MKIRTRLVRFFNPNTREIDKIREEMQVKERTINRLMLENERLREKIDFQTEVINGKYDISGKRGGKRCEKK